MWKLNPFKLELYNSGKLLIEPGGSVTIASANYNFNSAYNSQIVNRGTLKITGDFHLQGQGVYVWNLSSSLGLIVSGTIFVDSPLSVLTND